MGRFTVTYEIISPESAEEGEVEDHGFLLSDEQYVPIDKALEDKGSDYTMSLREALDLCSPDQNCGSWFSETSEERRYTDGAFQQRSLHPPEGITAASYKRVQRLLGIR